MEVGAGPLEAIAVTGDPSLGDVVGEVEHDDDVGLESPRPRTRSSSRPRPRPSPRATPWYASVDGVNRSHTTTMPLCEVGRDPLLDVDPPVLEHASSSSVVGIDAASIVQQPLARARHPLGVPPGSHVLSTSRPVASQPPTSRADLRALADALAALEDDERHTALLDRCGRPRLRMRRRGPKPETRDGAAEPQREPNSGQTRLERRRLGATVDDVWEIALSATAMNGAIVNDSSRHNRTIV